MRRRRPEKRIILPDTKYNDLSVAKFINYIMQNGKKGTAEKIFYGAMNIIENKTKTDGIKIFKKGIRPFDLPLVDLILLPLALML